MKGDWRGGKGPCVSAVLALLFMPGPVQAAAAGGGGSRHVLYLDYSEPGSPAALAMARGFQETLERSSPEPAEVFPLALDLGRLPGSDQEEAVLDYLDRRLSHRKLDAIVALGDPTLRCVLRWRPTHWPDVPLVAGGVDPRLVRRVRDELPGTAAFTVALDTAGSLNAALTLLPGTKRVAWVASGDPYRAAAERDLETFRDRLEIVGLLDLPFAEVERRLAALPEDTVVFYGAMSRDTAGATYTSRSALQRLAPVANRPIFGYAGTYLGYGIVGGSLLDLEEVGRVAARLTLRVLAGEPPSAIPLAEAGVNRLLFDGREMDRWGLSDSRLPPGSQVLYRSPSLWQEHRGLLLGGATILAVQAALIATLLGSVRRRRRAERQLRRLSGRLLTAHEEERSRIARELHDDISQRLSALAIELDQREFRRPPTGGDRATRAGDLAEMIRSLSLDVHAMAYRLHPAILEQLGLVPALRQFARQTAARHQVAVDVADGEWKEATVPRDVSLTLYRVAQEALHNAVRHSGAREVRIALRSAPRGLTLTVSDTGRGFEPSQVRGRQRLGLAGMEERLRLVDGALSVDSAPGHGTTVTALVSRSALVAPSEEPPAQEGSPP